MDLAEVHLVASALGGEFLTFRLGAEEYAIDILKVQEIRNYEPVTRIANAPAFISGVVDLRGTIVPIVDLRLKFALPEAQLDRFTVVIILNVVGRVMGIVVDAVSEVIRLANEAVRPTPEFASHLNTRFIRGLAKVDTRMVIVADIEALMTDPSMELVDARLAAA